MIDIIYNFVKAHWVGILITISPAIAFLYTQGYTLWLSRQAKKQAYNRVFSPVLKLYYSYLKHKSIYEETPPFPDEMLKPVIRHIDTFDKDLNAFSEAIAKDSEIIPEITFKVHALFDMIDRIRIVDRMKISGDQSFSQITENEILIIKRAQFSSLEEEFSGFFKDLISEIGKHTSAKRKFIKNLQDLNSEEINAEIKQDRKNVVKKYFESLNRQEAITDEVLAGLINELGLGDISDLHLEKENENNSFLFKLKRFFFLLPDVKQANVKT